jgi:hypothetical protein
MITVKTDTHQSPNYLLTCSIDELPKIKSSIDAFRKQNPKLRFGVRVRGRNLNRKQFYSHGFGQINMRNSMRQDLPVQFATSVDIYIRDLATSDILKLRKSIGV